MKRPPNRWKNEETLLFTVHGQYEHGHRYLCYLEITRRMFSYGLPFGGGFTLKAWGKGGYK